MDSGSIGYIIWGLSCIFGFCFLTLYDGYYKRDIHVISRDFCVYLLCQTIGSIIQIINSSARSQFLSYCFTILLSFAACVYAIIAILFIFVPIKYKHTGKLIKYGIPSIYVCFMISLIIIAPKFKSILLFSFYLPCAVCAYFGICLLYFWYKKQKHIFKPYYNKDINRVEKLKQLNCLLIMGVIAGTIGMIDFVYPAFGFLGLVPNDYSTLWTRTCDAIFYVPLIIPLIRFLDKMECFQLSNIRQPPSTDYMYQINDDHEDTEEY